MAAWPTRRGRFARVLAALAATAGIATAAGWNVTSPSAASGNPNQPSWWAKLQVVSAPGFRPAGDGHGSSSVSVGKNIDVSNEPGPQSETSIAINPNNGSQIVAGSNEIDRLPMRGYFSGDGGKTWGAVDLPLPPRSDHQRLRLWIGSRR